MPGLEVFRWTAPGAGPKTADPRLPCPQAPLQSMTTAVSLPIPVPAFVPATPFRDWTGHGRGRPPASSSSTDGAPPVAGPGHEDRGSRSSTRPPRGRPPKRLHQPRRRAEVTTPTRRSAPDRPERRSRPKPGDIATEPPRAVVASHRRPMREPAGWSLSQTTRWRMTRCRFTCGEPPTRLSGESQSSHHGFPFGCDSVQGAQHASPYLVDHRSIVTDRGPAASREARRWSLERIASDPVPMRPLRFREPPHRTQPGLCHARKRQQRAECTSNLP